MKLLINNKYEEVGFWSFMKCNILTYIVAMAIIWFCALIFLFTIGVIFG